MGFVHDFCGYTVEEYLLEMEAFHGARSPGMLLGGFMVARALGELGPSAHLNVVTETVVCLPDAVQILTPCTTGNGFLQVLDWGKFALTAYDRRAGQGVRAWVDAEAMGPYPRVRAWFHRSWRGSQKPSFEDLAGEIIGGGQRLVRHGRVRLRRVLKEEARIPTMRCPACGEFYAARRGPRCPACSGDAYYERI